MDLYQQNIIENYKFPKNKGVLENPTVSQKQVNASCGDSIEVYINIKEGKIDDIKFSGTGCAISQAAASMLTEKVKGISIEDVKSLTPKDVYDLLGIEISYSREKCALLALNTIKQAVSNL